MIIPSIVSAVLALTIHSAVAATIPTSDYEVYFSSTEGNLFEAGISTYGYRTPEKPITIDGQPQLFCEPQFVVGSDKRLFYQRVSVVREGANYRVTVSLSAYFDPRNADFDPRNADFDPRIYLRNFQLLRFDIPVAMGYPLTALNQFDYQIVEGLLNGDTGHVQIMQNGAINLMRSDGTIRALIVPMTARRRSAPQLSPKRVAETLQQLDETSKQLQH